MADLIPFPGFVGSAYGDKSPKVDSQDLVNWYVEYQQTARAKVPVALNPCPGFAPYVTLPTSPVRGLFAQNDRTFAVGGEVLYEIFRDRTYAVRAMTTLANPVAPTVTPSPLDPALTTPDFPVITHGGALGSTAYGYKVTAVSEHGETDASIEGTSSLGNATLSATNFNLVKWTHVEGAAAYKVYRTTGPGSGVVVGTVPGDQNFLQDIGTAGTVATPPSVNASGGTAGTTQYGYKIVARLGLGHTAASGEGTTNAGQATLDEDNYNTVTWPAVPNAHSYEVYRTTGGTPTPPVLLATVTELTYDDVGEEGESATPPADNTTGTAALENDGQPVSWACSGDAGNQLLIGSGSGAYLFDLTTGQCAQVVEGCTAVGYLKTYFVVLDAATSVLKSSESLDGFAWDGAQVYQRTSAGDRWLGMGVTSNQLYLLGSRSGDIYAFTGDDETRFAPYNDMTIPQGIIATASLNVTGGVLTWLGQNDNGAGVVWRTDAYNPLAISTRGMEAAIEQFSTLADATSFTYAEGAHAFYVLSFPSDDATWVFDDLTGEWHRRLYWDPNTMAWQAYRPWCHTFAFGGVGFGVHLVGDRASGVIAEMSTELQHDIDGTTLIRRQRQVPILVDAQRRLTIWQIVLDLESGLGLGDGQGEEPMVMLEISKDNGKTWGRPLWESAGRQGEYDKRVIFDRLGDAREWVIRITVTDPIPWRIAGALMAAQGGAA